jgi:hypothetical protein
VVGLPENPWPASDGITTVERVLRARAVRRRVGERSDDLELLDDRAGPPVRDDDRQGAVELQPDVDEMDVDAVDLGYPCRVPDGSMLSMSSAKYCRAPSRSFRLNAS